MADVVSESEEKLEWWATEFDEILAHLMPDFIREALDDSEPDELDARVAELVTNIPFTTPHDILSEFITFEDLRKSTAIWQQCLKLAVATLENKRGVKLAVEQKARLTTDGKLDREEILETIRAEIGQMFLDAEKKDQQG